MVARSCLSLIIDIQWFGCELRVWNRMCVKKSAEFYHKFTEIHNLHR